MKYVTPSLAIVLLVTAAFACNPSPGSQPATPAPIFDFPTEPPEVEPTSLVLTLTPQPTSTPAGEIYAWNDLAEIESGGVSIKIARLVIADKVAAAGQNFTLDPTLQEMPVVAQVIFTVKNISADKTLAVYPRHATVDTGTESFFLVEFPYFVGEIVDGGIAPGEMKTGGFWFGFRQTPMKDVQSLSLSFTGPYNVPTDELNTSTGPDYYFQLDLSERRYDPVPDELKSLK